MQINWKPLRLSCVSSDFIDARLLGDALFIELILIKLAIVVVHIDIDGRTDILNNSIEV